MNREAEKIEYEHGVILSFLGKAGIEVDPSTIRPGDHTHGEPDVLCESIGGASLAFELGRLTNPDLMQVQKSWNPQNGTYVRTRDYSGAIATKKLEKKYKVDCPVALVLYTEFPNGTPERFIVEVVGSLAKTMNHSYSAVWLMGKDLYLLHERS